MPTRLSASPPCPICGAASVRIVYGEPGPDLRSAAARREVVLGGCVRSVEDPTWRCSVCEAEFGEAITVDALDETDAPFKAPPANGARGRG